MEPSSPEFITAPEAWVYALAGALLAAATVTVLYRSRIALHLNIAAIGLTWGLLGYRAIFHGPLFDSLWSARGVVGFLGWIIWDLGITALLVSLIRKGVLR